MRANILAIALLLLPGVAVARDLPSGGLTLDEIMAWLQNDVHVPAAYDTSSDGTKNIKVSVDGGNFHIYTYDCKGGDRCGSLQFSAGYDTKGAWSPGPMNDWNRDNRWVHAYVDKVNDPWIEYDVDLTPGGTYELLGDELGIWRDSVSNFRKFIKW